MSEKSEDCLQCRLTSGAGLLAMGGYVIHQSKKVQASSRHIVSSIGYVLGMIGVLRIFALPPFKTGVVEKEKTEIEETEGSEYIIGKIPPKFQ